LQDWLSSWTAEGGIVPGAGGKGGKGGRGGGGGGGDTRKKAVLISGPPGIGKTTTVHMVCAKMGVRVVGAIHPPIRSDPPIALLVLAAINSTSTSACRRAQRFGRSLQGRFGCRGESARSALAAQRHP
jgi:nucleoside-triphosphatase THEP1